MPGIIVNNQGQGPQLPDQFDPYDTTQWKWDVGRTEDPGEATITTGDATATKVGWLLDPSKLLAAQAFFLGYSYVDQPTLTLKRSVPAFCPESPWLLCTKFSYKGVKYTGDQSYPWDDFPGALPLPGMTYYHCTVTFEARDFLAIPDEDMQPGDSESKRFFSIVPNDETELVSIDGGQYVYRSTQTEDTFATPSGGPIAATTYLVKGADFRVHANRTGLLATWYDVAEDFICDQYTQPVALTKAKGTVNRTAFLGRPAYTMLLDNFKIEKKPAVIATLEADQQKFLLKVEMYYKYTNPTAGDDNEIYGGWLLVPGPTGNSRANWYYVWNYNANNAHTDQNVGLYDQYDHNLIFGPWQNA